MTRLSELATHPGLQDERTPAFVIDAGSVRRNVDEVLHRAGRPEVWRCHVKTARSGWAYRLLLDRGLTRFKCSTVEELRALAGAGAPDVLLAFPVVGPAQRAVLDVVTAYPQTEVSVLVDSVAALDSWADGALGVFLDLDTGMRRTGVRVEEVPAIVALAGALVERGHRFRGLHAYDGHLADAERGARRDAVGRDQYLLGEAAAAIVAAGVAVEEVVAGSTHTFTEVLAHPWPGPGDRTVGPGTVLYNDDRARNRFAEDQGFEIAAGVLSRVVSVDSDRVTADAGLTAAQVDGGRPHVRVAGRPGLEVVSVSQEHLVLRETANGSRMRVGDLLMLVPAHVDTAITQFDRLLVVDGENVEAVPAVGRWNR